MVREPCAINTVNIRFTIITTQTSHLVCREFQCVQIPLALSTGLTDILLIMLSFDNL